MNRLPSKNSVKTRDVISLRKSAMLLSTMNIVIIYFKRVVLMILNSRAIVISANVI